MRRMLCSLFILFGFGSIAQADTDPSAYLESIANTMISAVEENMDAIKADPEVSEKLVKQHLLPVIDTETFSRRTLGSKIWKSLSDQQKTDFINGFINKVINKYAKGISLYDGQAFIFKKAEISKKTGNARVKSAMEQTGSEPLDIHYYLSRKSGDWLITNIIVAGTDMRKSYRNQFRPRINEIGLDKFIKELNASQAVK